MVNTILEQLETNDIFFVRVSKDKVTIEIGEAMERYSSLYLTKTELLQLIKELEFISSQMGK